MDKLRRENDKLRTDLQSTKEELSKLSKVVAGKLQDAWHLIVPTWAKKVCWLYK